MKAAGWLNGLWALVVACGLLAASCATQLDRHKAPLADPQPPTLHTQSPIPKPKLQVTYAHVPLHFEPNQGQTDEHVHFLSRGRGYTLFLTSTEAVFALRKPRKDSQHPLAPVAGQFSSPLPSWERIKERGSNAVDSAPLEQTALRMQFVGANPNPRVAGHEALPGQVNYFIGNDPDKWRTNISTFAKVQYRDVYPGVDVVYYGNQQQLEFDFVVAPGADPTAIRLAFDGLIEAGLVPAQDGRPQESPLQITDNGDLIVSVAGGEVRLRKPLIYQEIDGVKQPIPGGYILLSPQSSSLITFQVAAYDTSKPLIIDPVLSYSTYLGGTGSDSATPLAPDGSGGVWVAGSTASTNFPTAGGGTGDPGDAHYDAFVSHFTASGALTYSTYLGGNSDDYASKLAPDGSGGVWVAGHIYSTNFPTAGGGIGDSGGDGFDYDAFVSHFTASGALIFSTYLGGNDGDLAHALAPDGSGGVWVAGRTESTNFPTSGGGSGDPRDLYGDAFVSHFTASGALAYSTYLGGNSGAAATALAPDGSGGVWVAGETASTDFPTAGGGRGNPDSFDYDAFVSHFTTSGALTYSTYLGGNSEEYATTLAPDSSGGAWVAGPTRSTNFPIAGGGRGDSGGENDYDAFVSHFTTSGALTFSTYLEGTGNDYAYALAPDGSDGVWVAGRTASTNFSTTGGGSGDPGDSVGYDAFVSHFTASGALAFSTYLGGNNVEYPYALILDNSGGAWVAGTTNSTNFPTAGGGSGDLGDANDDAFVSYFTESGTLAFSTYLGGNDADLAYALALDGSGGVWVAGYTASTDFPTVNPFQAANAGGSYDAFVARINKAAGDFLDISTRGLVGTGDGVLIGGFIIEDGPITVLIRALGPSLALPPFNVPGVLANPFLQLFDGKQSLITFNDSWQTDANSANIPVGLRPSNSAEAALLVTLQPGLYTGIVSGVGGTTGVALVEVIAIR